MVRERCAVHKPRGEDVVKGHLDVVVVDPLACHASLAVFRAEAADECAVFCRWVVPQCVWLRDAAVAVSGIFEARPPILSID